jgi:hypothetical protein
MVSITGFFVESACAASSSAAGALGAPQADRAAVMATPISNVPNFFMVISFF